MRLRPQIGRVEHQHQFDLLRAEGCDEFQGYYCRPPLPEAELLRFLRDEKARHARAQARTFAAAVDGT